MNLLNASAFDVAIATSKDKPTQIQAAILHSFSDNPAGAIGTGRVLKAFRQATGGDGQGVTREPRSERYEALSLVLGRRSGKSSLAAVFAITAAMDARIDPKLGPGEEAYIFVIGPHQDACATIMGGVAGRLDYAGIPYKRTAKEIRIEGRPVVIRITVASELAPRGKSCALAILEEASLLPTDDDASGSDKEIATAVQGAMLNLKGRMIKIGTPWIKSGVLWEDFSQHFGKTTGDTLVFRAATWEAMPSLSRAATLKSITDPRYHAREYGAEFGEGAGTFLLASEVDAAVQEYGNDVRRQPGVTYAMAIDWATRNDFLAVVVGHRELRRSDHPSMPPRDVLVIDCIRLIKPLAGDRLDAEMQVRKIAEIARRYGDPIVHRDLNAAEALDSLFRQQGVRTQEVSSAVASQASRFGAMGARFRNGTIELPSDCPEAVKQLKALEERFYSKGRVKYEVPKRHGHDDFPDALSYICDPDVLAGLVPGGDIVCQTHAHWNPDTGVTVEQRFYLRETWMGEERLRPCAPPKGTPAARKAALERRSRGEFMEGDDEELIGVDPRDYLDFNAPILHGAVSPREGTVDFGAGFIRGRRSMSAGASTDEVEALERVSRDERGRVRQALGPAEMPDYVRFRRGMAAGGTSEDVERMEREMFPDRKPPAGYRI